MSIALLESLRDMFMACNADNKLGGSSTCSSPFASSFNLGSIFATPQVFKYIQINLKSIFKTFSESRMPAPRYFDKL